MKTLYIDVYFMINFTVDILAVFIALRLIHAKINITKLTVSGLLGAGLATAELFIKSNIINVCVAGLFITLITCLSCKGVSLYRRIRFIISFYIAAFLISGAVSFLYSLMDKYLDKLLMDFEGTTNRKALVFSLIILLIIGVIRVFIMTLTDSVNQKSSRLIIMLEGKTIEVDALIDTGNLVKDPMNMNPVIFLKKNIAENILPRAIIDLTDIDSLSIGYKKRIRLIPVTRKDRTHVMTGVRVDKVIVCNKEKEEIDATIVIDKEEGTYGGYYALAPCVAICNDT